MFSGGGAVGPIVLRFFRCESVVNVSSRIDVGCHGAIHRHTTENSGGNPLNWPPKRDLHWILLLTVLIRQGTPLN